MEKMIIEVWSDFVCPFCYVGKRKLEKAIKASPYKDQVEVVYKAYELNPNAPQVPVGEGYEAFAATKGVSEARAREMFKGIIEAAKEYDLHYDFEHAKQVNTKKAHRLAKWARTLNKEHELTELLMEGYFIKGANINDDTTLLGYVKKLGLDVTEADKVIKSDAYLDEVKYEIFEGKQVGAEGVPFFVFNNKYGIPGAQPDELFSQTLQQTMEEFNPRPFIINTAGASSDGGLCGPDDNC